MNLTTETVPLDALTPHPRNVRQGDVGAISESLKAHGQYRPIVAQRSTGHILAGNHTFKAAQALGWSEIAVTFLDVSDDQAVRIMLADNRTNDLATYDDAALVETLRELGETDDGLAGTLYDGDDLDDLLDKITDVPDDGLSHYEQFTKSLVRHCKPNDVWLLGDHRLMCGDARNHDDVMKLVGELRVNLAVTSPPYAQQREYEAASGFVPIAEDDYVRWYAAVSANTKSILAHDGSMLINIKPSVLSTLETSLYVMDLVIAHVREWGWMFATEFCWERGGVPKQPVLRLKNGFEPVYQFALDRWKFRPDNVRHASDFVPYNVGSPGDTNWKSRHGKSELMGSSNIRQGLIDAGHGTFVKEGLAYPSNRIPAGRANEAFGHPAAFSVSLPEFFIKLFTDEQDIIYDAFGGSGSTLIAAQDLMRKCVMMELSADYCDIICGRFQKHTGVHPVLEATNETHSFINDAD